MYFINLTVSRYLKTVFIMARIELRHLDVDGDGYVKAKQHNDFKELIQLFTIDGTGSQSVCLLLDKSTAIRLAKTLRTEINKIQS